MSKMSRTQLEQRVLAIIDTVRNGDVVEDDGVELKREWPDPMRARQLAGLANRLHGEDLLYIVGLDEATGDTSSSPHVELADWWAATSARFDHVAPDLIMNVAVPLGDGESVVALLFATDRAPYVVKDAAGSPRLEIPIRDGTGTRSARRDEIIRMSYATTSAPVAHVVDAHALATWTDQPPEWTRGSEHIRGELSCQVELFLETVSESSILLPWFLARARVSVGSLTIGASIEHDYWGKDGFRDPRGVYPRPDGIYVGGPGSAALRIDASSNEDVFREAFASAIQARIEIDLLLAPAGPRVAVTCDLMRRNTSSAALASSATRLGSFDLKRVG